MKKKIKRLAMEEGAADVGVASQDRFSSGLPSMDATYLLPTARAIISVMLPLDGELIRRYLAKEDHRGHQEHETRISRKTHRICESVRNFLESEGYRAVTVDPNLDYRFKNEKAYKRVPSKVRQGVTDWLGSGSGPVRTRLKRYMVQALYETAMDYVDWRLTPSFSHRYGAVAAGLGSFGWSSNVFHPEYGSRVLFQTVVTDAPLKSDPMLEETPCDGCRICTRVCQVGMIHPREKAQLTIGGKLFTHARKGHNLRCIFCCAGFTGQSRHKGWSTWSPGRITLPETDDRIEAFWDDFVKENLWQHNYYSKVLGDLTFHSEYGFLNKPYERFMTTCGNCQIVCWKTRSERKENYEILVRSGEVVEGPDFSFKVINNTQGRGD